MKHLFRLSSQSKPGRYPPPAGPPPAQPSIPHGEAASYYGFPPGPASPLQAANHNNFSTQNHYAPPPGPPPPAASHTHGNQFQAGIEDPLAMLSRYDTVILVDDSGSMEMYWDQTREALIGVVQKAVQYDTDGIDLFFFNDHQNALNCNSPEKVRQVFRSVLPRRSTPTASSIKKVIDPYLDQLHRSKTAGAPPVKPLNLIVLTDGAPDRGQDPEQVIVDIGRYLDSNRFPLNQLGISFVQIGDDPEAARHLASLDDDLKAKYKIRDFVDCTPYQASTHSQMNAITSDFILKALIGGVNRKIDNLRI